LHDCNGGARVQRGLVAEHAAAACCKRHEDDELVLQPGSRQTRNSKQCRAAGDCVDMQGWSAYTSMQMQLCPPAARLQYGQLVSRMRKLTPGTARAIGSAHSCCMRLPG
jgi:hypothetical protein